jgi:hypothetical protein
MPHPFGMFPDFRARRAALYATAALALGAGVPAVAETPLLDLPSNLHVVADLRLVLTDGEPSWVDGGFGRARFGGNEDFRVVPASAQIAWRGPIAWTLSGTLAIAAQDGQDQPVDLIQSYLTWRPVPKGATRLSARAGLYWPEISLEHEGPAWQVSDMITPSAINSWVGEEVKVVGLEGSASHPVGSGRVSATLGVFGFNDTAGTLLSFRGWALHDQQTGAFSRHKLPPLNPLIRKVQPPWTAPTTEIDRRPGFYGRIAWQMAAPVALDAFYYDNRADPEAVTDDRQWGWQTRFINVGARANVGPHTLLLAQALSGTTYMGFKQNGCDWVETRFRSAYLRLTHQLGPVALTGRLDLFDTRQRGSRLLRDDNEDGWSATSAASWRVTPQVQLTLEWLHAESDRASRARLGLGASQNQDQVQAGARLSF